MKRVLFTLLLGALASSQLAQAALKAGDKAPDFSAQASLGGQVSTFSLAENLKKGPVVLYFYPAAFTSGCTIEAHLFAEAIDKYKALGATVIGVSNDKIETLNKFSVSECRHDDQIRLRQPDFLCDRAESHHHLRIQQHEPGQACRKHAAGIAAVGCQEQVKQGSQRRSVSRATRRTPLRPQSGLGPGRPNKIKSRPAQRLRRSTGSGC